MNDLKTQETPSDVLLLHAWGGLGGQLLALSYAVWIAKHHNRAVKLIFHDGGASLRPLELQDVLASTYIKSMGISYSTIHDFTATSSANKAIGSIFSMVKTKLKQAKAYFFNKFNISQKAYILPDITMAELVNLNQDTQELNGYSTDYSVFEEVQSEICAALEYSNYPNFLMNGGQENSLSIHWRLGDYLNNPFHGTVSFESITKAINLMELPPKTRIKLYTDSPSIAAKLIKESGYHQDIEIQSSSIWNDMFQMSRSKYFVGNHSAVSLLVSLSIQSSNPESSIFFPSKWFANENDNSRFHPPIAFRNFSTFE